MIALEFIILEGISCRVSPVIRRLGIGSRRRLWVSGMGNCVVKETTMEGSTLISHALRDFLLIMSGRKTALPHCGFAFSLIWFILRTLSLSFLAALNYCSYSASKISYLLKLAWVSSVEDLFRFIV